MVLMCMRCIANDSELYVGPPARPVRRLVHELKGFARVAIEPSETKTTNLTLSPHAFAYWGEGKHGWSVAPGMYTIGLGSSSREKRLIAEMKITEAQANALNKTMDLEAKSAQVDGNVCREAL